MCSAVGCSMRSGTDLLSAVKMYRFPTNPSRRLHCKEKIGKQILNLRFVTSISHYRNSDAQKLKCFAGKPSSDAEHPDYVPSIFSSMKNKGSSSSVNRYNRQVKRREVWNAPLTAKRILEQIRPGDVIFADRGFPVKDLVAERGASLVLPASTKGKKQLSSAEVINSRKVSRLRVHIERCIGRLKTFRILKSLWPISLVNNKTSEETCIGDDVIFVVAALCNILKGRLIRQM
ncbi:putative isl2eu-5 hm [Trichonephila clavipes]|nr:putative isl2eu-5 hm [Trichonephila clavipes]